MYLVKAALFALTSATYHLQVTSLELAPPAELLTDVPQSGSGIIAPLLRSPQSGSFEERSGLTPRGYYCDPGYHACSDGGCCSNNDYCGTFGGIKGCCPNGKLCSGTGGCTKSGYAKCSGESFCCPLGYYCYRDSAGNPKCSSNSAHTSTSTHYITTTHKTTYTPAPAPAPTTKKTTTSAVITLDDPTISLSPIPSFTLNTDTTVSGFIPSSTPTFPATTQNNGPSTTLGASNPLNSNHAMHATSASQAMSFAAPILLAIVSGLLLLN